MKGRVFMMQRRFWIGLLFFAFLVGILSPLSFALATGENGGEHSRAVSSPSHSIASQKSYTVLPGMKETVLLLKDRSGSPIDGHMMEISPGTAVTAKVSYPGYYKAGSTPAGRKAFADAPVWSKKTTTAQAADFTAATGQPVLFAINTDNFITESTVTPQLTVGQPCGHLIMEGNACQTTDIRSRPFFAVLKDGSFVIRDANADLSDVVEATSGRIYIVKDGKNVVDPAHSQELGLQPFNSIGLKKDGTVVVFQVDGRRSDSIGFTEMEMAEYLLAQGVYTALILDGGGSATFASRREGDSKLTLRNRPSDGTERALGSTLLFMSNQDSLFFDYTADAAARERYQSFTYNGHDFDTSAAWMATAGTADTVSVDPYDGTMTITKSAQNTLGYCYAQTRSTSGKALRFRPDYADYLQIRMELTGFDPAGANTNFSIHFYADGGTAQITNAVRHLFGSGYVFDGRSILLTLPIGQKFRDVEFVDAVKVNFSNLTGGGTIRIDYLYMGPKVSLPEQDYLFFDFLGSTLDADRYHSKTYRLRNFDTSAWGYNSKKSSQPLMGDDALSFDVMATTDNYVNTGHSPYIHTIDSTGSLTAPALCYRPGQQDYLQIRYRMRDCASVPGLTPVLRFYFSADGKGAFVGNVKKDLTTEEMTSDTYYVLTLPLYTHTAYQSAQVIDYFRLNFQNVRTAEGKTGRISVDYIYVGPLASLPQQDSFFIDFTNDAAAQQRYQSKTYGFRNYDTGSWAFNPKKCHRPTFDNGNMIITVAPTTDNYVNTGHSPYFQTSDINATVGKAVLRYKPGTRDYLQVRLKMEQCSPVPGKSAMLRFFYTNDDSASTAGYVSYNLTAEEMNSGKYLLITLPLHTSKTYQNSEYIRRFQITMQNLCSAAGQTGRIHLDYIYVGTEEGLPTAQYTVTFVGADGKTLQTQTVHKGGSATYTGTAPTKASDASYHYSFKGWDKTLTNITADLTVTAQFTATVHSFSYANSDNTYHKGSCACGYCMTAPHGWNSGTVTTGPTCTETGVRTYTCTTCKATKTESLSALGHRYTYKATKNPTTTATGTLTGTCSVCKGTTTATIPKLNATDYTKATTKAPTCTESGTDTYKWNVTAYGTFTFTATTKALGHSYTYEIHDAMFHFLGCSNCDLSEKVPHSYVEGICVCGEKETKEPVELPTLKLGHTLNLASDISVNFVILKQNLEGFDPGSIYVECVLDTYEGNVKTGTRTVRLEPVDKGIHYYFTLTGLTAIQMNDSISTTLYGTKDGQPYYSPTDEYSIASYAYAQLNKTEISATLKTLCADLLRYGAKAQIFKSYRLDALADSSMTGEHKAYLSDMEAVTFGNTNVVLNDLPNAPITWAGKSLSLESKVALKFVFHPAAYKEDLSKLTLRLSYTDTQGATKTVTVSNPELYNSQLGYYVFTVDTLLAAELRAVVSAQVYVGDSPVSATLQYSPDTYGNGKSGSLLDLCKALFAYSDSAKAYFAP